MRRLVIREKVGDVFDRASGITGCHQGSGVDGVCLHHSDDLREDCVDLRLRLGSELAQSCRKTIMQRLWCDLCGRSARFGKNQTDTSPVRLSTGTRHQAARLQTVNDTRDCGPAQLCVVRQRARRVRVARCEGQQAHELRSRELMPLGQLAAEEIHCAGDPPKGAENVVIKGSTHGDDLLMSADGARQPVLCRFPNRRAWSVLLTALVFTASLPGAPNHASATPVHFRAADKPVKVLLLSSSLGRFRFGSFAQYLERVCPATEFASRTKHAVNTRWMIETFRKDVLRPRSVDTRQGEHWLLYQGGLNSVSTPKRTVADMVRLFRMAHRAGFKVLAIGVTPWGKNDDSRFDGFEGLRRHDKTRHLADFVAGRLTPQRALRARRAKQRDGPKWLIGELPDIGVDVLDTTLRNKKADLRPAKPLIRQWKHTRWVQRRYPDMERAVRRARAVPRWFPNPEQSWDHVHLDFRGHRTIAKTTCGRLPATWRCDCKALDSYRWQRGRGLIND
ncbi:MAG: hypothetical protein ACI9OJ_000074 [Myxococcota bacterium]|jgi:hypothetical protein